MKKRRLSHPAARRPSLTAIVAAVMTLSLGACMNLEPPLPAAGPGVPAQWPKEPVTQGAAPAAHADGVLTGARGAADVGWRDFFTDPSLAQWIAVALDNNRDLRVAALRVEQARAIYRVQRAEQLPGVGIDAAASRASGAGMRSQYTVALGLAAFELDFFGRVHNLAQAALEQYLATESAQQAAQLSLVAEVSATWLRWMADRESMRVAQAALANRKEALALMVKRFELGAVSELDLSQSRTAVEQARTDASRFAGMVEQDRNALALLTGAPVDDALQPPFFRPEISGLGALPAGLPSEVLLRRPDVQQAEHQLRAANAGIGAARAAFFPSISLTAGVGSASTELSGLFGAGSRFWTFAPRMTVPIFTGGALQSQLEATQAARDIALAQYEQAIQSGFRDVADALALTRTLGEQKAAQSALVAAAARAEELARARYEAGSDSYLVLLDAQRTLHAAQLSLIATQLTEQVNRVTLYRVLGGGWTETTR